MNQCSATIVCRCEEVTLEQLQHAYLSGSTTSRQLKMETRATMGACQGRVCRYLVDRFVHTQNPELERQAEHLSQRQPIRPVTFGQLAEESNHDGSY